MRRNLRIARVGIVGGIAAAVLAGTAYATIPGGDGVIHGCYAKSGGSLRVIDGSTTNCKSGEGALDWSRQGVPGPKGDAGAPGPVGPQGETGAPGGVSGYEIVSAHTDFSSQDVQYAGVSCPAGKLAVGGGAHMQGDFLHNALDWSAPSTNGSGWGAQANEIDITGQTWRLVVYAICANPA